MRKRIKAYLDYIDKIIAHELPVTSSFDEGSSHHSSAKKDIVPTRKEYEALIQRHLEQIAFFQHERLIHLIVTVLFALLTFMSFFVCIAAFSFSALIVMAALMVLLVPYIMHYYLLENGVQKMYRQYDELVKRLIE